MVYTTLALEGGDKESLAVSLAALLLKDCDAEVTADSLSAVLSVSVMSRSRVSNSNSNSNCIERQ